MKRIAITGGIGSGKTYISKVLRTHGINVYDCDAAAKNLMLTSDEIIRRIKQTVGEDAYDSDGKLNKALLSSFIMLSEENKQTINNIVHPWVARDFMASGYRWLESAILFDSGFDKVVHFDEIICVTAPMDIRIRRIMARNGITHAAAKAWIGVQLPQEEILRRSNHEILNDGERDIHQQINQILNIIHE